MTKELRPSSFIGLVTTWLSARSYSFIFNDNLYDNRFIKIFELIVELTVKSNDLKQVMRGSLV